MNVDDARSAYRTIADTLNRERGMRDRVLSEPRRTAALNELDAALDALAVLASVAKLATDAGLLTAGNAAPEQQPLLDVPEAKYP